MVTSMLSARARADANARLRRQWRPVGGCAVHTSTDHLRSPAHRYRVDIYIDTGSRGHVNTFPRPRGEFVPQFYISADAFMDDFGSLVYTTRFA